jgi:acyl-CoA synthetase (NDP forming)
MDKASQLDAIFLPRTLAVIGVSAGDDKFGSRFLKALLDFGFKGRIFPVNPKGGELFGLPIYRSLAEIPEPVESADIMVPARFVPQVLEECLAKGVKGVQIFSSGFTETGDPEGAALEKQLKEIASRGIRFIGPNCFGVYCPASGHTLLPGGDFPKESGPVAFISQSGGHAVEFAREAMGRGIRFSKAVSYGNACDVNEADLLEYMARDPETKVITMYLEGPREGRRFLELVKKTAPKKPIVLWKAGLTPAGGRAVRSHTGSLGGEEAVWQALFKQTAAIRVGSLQELADTTQALLTLPRTTGRRIGMVGGGGGTSVAATDACAQVGLEVPPFDEAMRQRLARILPPAGTMMRNPVDVGVPIVPPDTFRRVLETVAAAECVDTLIATQPLFYILSGRFGPLMESEEFVQALVGVPAAVRDSSGKPVVVVLPVGGEEIEMTEVERRRRQARDRYLEMGILALPTLDRAVRAIANVVGYYERAASTS